MHDVKSWELCFIWRITENYSSGLPGWLRWWKVCLQCRGPKFKPWVGKTPWRRKWHPTPVLLPGKSHGWRSLVACSPWGRYESDTTEWLHFHFSLPCIGEGNVNPLQCSCLVNPRDGGNPSGLLSMGSHRVGHDWSDLAAAAACARHYSR